ncbi:MAG: type III PLP-dependent enzyme [Caulobacterales bacterium]
MRNFSTALRAIQSLGDGGPIACIRPERAAAAAHWFRAHFPGDILYAVKANPSPWALDAIYGAGVRMFDVASEQEAALVAGRFPDAKLCFMHPVKSRRAIARAYFDLGCRVFVLDTIDELEKILEETQNAADLTLVVRLAVANEGSAMPLTGKFGALPHESAELLRRTRAVAAELGVSFHVGSQCMRPQAFASAMMSASRQIVQAGVTVDVVDVGGGFPSAYPGQNPPPLQDYMIAIRDAFEEMAVLGNADLWCEPGRALVAEATSIAARVELRKGDSLYLNDGAYGNLFDAAHAQWTYPTRVLRKSGETDETLQEFHLYGPTCDSMDSMPGPWMLPSDVREGDWIEFGMLGAYGVAMQTKFNGFGDTAQVQVADQPWPSLYVARPEAQPAVAAEEVKGSVVRLASRQKKTARRRR